MNISFGIPTRKKDRMVNDFNHGTPSLLMKIAPKGKESSRFALNKEAIELLKLDLDGGDKILFGFDDDRNQNRVFITSDKILGVEFDMQEGMAVRVAKNATFANKKYYTYIKDFLNLTVSDDNVFEIEAIPHVHNAYGLTHKQHSDNSLNIQHDSVTTNNIDHGIHDVEDVDIEEVEELPDLP